MAVGHPLLGDADLWRRVIALMAEDRRHASFWAAAERGSSIVTRWQSVELRQRAIIAQAQSRHLLETSARLQDQSSELRKRLTNRRSCKRGGSAGHIRSR